MSTDRWVESSDDHPVIGAHITFTDAAENVELVLITNVTKTHVTAINTAGFPHTWRRDTWRSDYWGYTSGNPAIGAFHYLVAWNTPRARAISDAALDKFMDNLDQLRVLAEHAAATARLTRTFKAASASFLADPANPGKMKTLATTAKTLHRHHQPTKET